MSLEVIKVKTITITANTKFIARLNITSQENNHIKICPGVSETCVFHQDVTAQIDWGNKKRIIAKTTRNIDKS